MKNRLQTQYYFFIIKLDGCYVFISTLPYSTFNGDIPKIYEHYQRRLLLVVIRIIPLSPEFTDPHVYKYTLYWYIIGSTGATVSLLNLHFILRCGIPVVFPEYIIKKKKEPVTAQLYCSNWKVQPHVLARQSSHYKAVYIRSINRKLYTCSLHIVRNGYCKRSMSYT